MVKNSSGSNDSLPIMWTRFAMALAYGAGGGKRNDRRTGSGGKGQYETQHGWNSLSNRIPRKSFAGCAIAHRSKLLFLSYWTTLARGCCSVPGTG